MVICSSGCYLSACGQLTNAIQGPILHITKPNGSNCSHCEYAVTVFWLSRAVTAINPLTIQNNHIAVYSLFMPRIIIVSFIAPLKSLALVGINPTTVPLTYHRVSGGKHICKCLL